VSVNACCVQKFDDFVDDFLQFVDSVQRTSPLARARPPCFLLGYVAPDTARAHAEHGHRRHSMGGAIATLVALRSRERGVWPWAGVILSGPVCVCTDGAAQCAGDRPTNSCA
jgi:alpha-beta hydrolase superfamily lysophospholipase